VKNAELTPARRPLIFQRWLPPALLGGAVLLLVVAGVVDLAAVRIVAAVLAGVLLTAGVVAFAGSLFIRRVRRRIRDLIEERVPAISPASRNR
jgi:uncharacterized membrane protein YgdD (TMEM256/DUF423 family)